MGADISRMRFDSLNDFGGLVLQQGRLLLDADFNEFVSMLDRRFRAETSDLTSFGPDPDRAGVAWVPRHTADGFRISVEPTSGEMTIGKGRMYVDGLLAENHGGAPMTFDGLLSEPTGTTDLSYNDQPYWPTPEEPPAEGLAYLDVWQREVTYLKDPDLVEVAVGVDSSARLQTVWQVRVLPSPPGFNCASPDSSLDEWQAMIRPSTGRLTTGTIDVDDEDDPCALPPIGGYRGRENQTYRVEIHEGGEQGSATFKWSRDNGSVAFPVVEVESPTSIRVASLGRDDVLRISTGDWVEVLDDHREFNREPGELRKVTVDEATRTITFDDPLLSDLSGPLGPEETAARRFRVRRWDQAGKVLSGAGATLHDLDAASTGAIPLPSMSSTQVVLEHGIVVSFSAGQYRSGDYWIFAARTEDTSVEELVEAPPLGVHHHYARLGLVNFATAAVADCRRLWPPTFTGGGDVCGDCTFCLAPEQHNSGEFPLQEAVNAIAGTGGTICLAPGVYEIANPVTITDASSIRIRGQGLRTVVVATGTAFDVSSTWGMTIENMTIISGRSPDGAVVFRDVVAANLEGTAVLSYGVSEGHATIAGGGSFTLGTAVMVSRLALWVSIRNNVLIGRRGIDSSMGDDLGVLAAGLKVEDNIIAGVRGIDLGGLSLYLPSCRIAGNEIVAADEGGVVATGKSVPSGSLSVDNNRILTAGEGIRVGSDAVVIGNSITGLGKTPDANGIVMDGGGLFADPGVVQVSRNRVHRRSGAGLLVRTPVETLAVSENIFTEVGLGIGFRGAGGVDTVKLHANHIRQVVEADEERGATVGVLVTRARSVEVVDNTISGVGSIDGLPILRAGILVVACPQIRLHGNVVENVAPLATDEGFAAGILGAGPFNTATVSDNSVQSDQGLMDDGGLWGIQITSWIESQFEFGLGRRSVALENGFLVFTDGSAFLAPAATSHVTVSDNLLTGVGFRSTCEVRASGDVVVDGNQFEHHTNRLAVFLGGASVIASSNRVRGPNSKAAMFIETGERSFAAVGNLTAGGVFINSNPLFAPWDALNPVAP